MERNLLDLLRRDERITLELRALYEAYGFRKYRMSKFEEYGLYLENKNFLKSQQIITFHSLDGQVLALKPDVTLSIAKNTHATAASSEKVYYLENVYRLDKRSGSYREISQIGLEYIGKLDVRGAYEVLALAQQTLAAIHPNHRMQLSHIGFWVSLLDGLNIEEGLRRELMELIRGKRLHELKARLTEANVAPAAEKLILTSASFSGEFSATLSAAREIAMYQGMTEALDELEAAYRLLSKEGFGEDVTLDFSLVNDSDYYGGLIFQGFVEGVPRALLTGGYYGNLLKKFGRELDAMGFAVDLNELNLLYRSTGGADVDALILYDEDTDLEALLACAQDMMAKGKRVRMERTAPEGIRTEKTYRFGKDGLKEAGKDA